MSDTKNLVLTEDDLRLLNSRQGLQGLLRQKEVDVEKLLAHLRYMEELEKLQIELVKLQYDVIEKNRRVVILFEGRDAAGKGGTIRRFTKHLNPRSIKVVALPKPTEVEKGQWYFQRYIKTLPDPGTIAFYDRSWYNRAVIEPVMGFCTEDQYRTFLLQVPEFEHMLHEDGIELIKFWLTIDKKEQKARLDARKEDPLKHWKLSPIDEKAQSMWKEFTHYRDEMFARTHNSFSPWVVVKANSKKRARLETMRYVLNQLDYAGKESAGISLIPDSEVVERFHRPGKNGI